MDKNDYEQRIEVLRDKITLFSSCFLIWENLCDVTEAQIDAMDSLRAFFAPVRHICLEQGRIYLVATFEKNAKTANLPGLVEAAELSQQEFAPYLSPRDFKEIRATLNEIHPIVNKMRPARHQTAHSDVTIAPPLYKVGDRRKIVLMAQRVYCLLYYGFTGDLTSFDLVNKSTEQDTQRLIGILKLAAVYP